MIPDSHVQCSCQEIHSKIRSSLQPTQQFLHLEAKYILDTAAYLDIILTVRENILLKFDTFSCDRVADKYLEIFLYSDNWGQQIKIR